MANGDKFIDLLLIFKEKQKYSHLVVLSACHGPNVSSNRQIYFVFIKILCVVRRCLTLFSCFWTNRYVMVCVLVCCRFSADLN